MQFKNLIVNVNKQGIAKILFSNKKSKNAINPDMIYEIKEAIGILKKSKSCRILIFSGDGETFSSGADLLWMKKSKSLNYEENNNEAKRFTEILQEIDNFPKPTISLVNGHAFGGALGIIAASDFSIGSEKSKYCFSEVKLGLIPAMIGPYVLRALGYLETKKLFLTGELFNAKKALKIGLIDEVADLSDYEKRTPELIKNLLSGGPNAQNSIKTFLKEINLKKIDNTLINDTAETISRIRITSEAQEGLKAFLEKRKPQWK